mgnify:CR=1 FL=1
MGLSYLEGIEQRPDLSVALMQNIDSLFSNLEKLSSWQKFYFEWIQTIGDEVQNSCLDRKERI